MFRPWRSFPTMVVSGLLVGLVPAISLAFAGRAGPHPTRAVQTLLRIGLPLRASRGVARAPAVQLIRNVGVNLSFFVLVTAIAEGNRAAFADLGLVLSL